MKQRFAVVACWLLIALLSAIAIPQSLSAGGVGRSSFLCGDINGDNQGPDISDLIYLVDYMFQGGAPPPWTDAADVNNTSGPIDISDLIYMVDWMFTSGPELNCPEFYPPSPLLADHHTVALFELIPDAVIEQAKSELKLFYGHTSHGNQLLSGMNVLRDENPLYDFNNGAGSLSIEETFGDLGGPFDFLWVEITRNRLNQPGNDRNVVVWSFCGGMTWHTDTSLGHMCDSMVLLELEFPSVRFIYMTGHLDGTGLDGNLFARNDQLRLFCTDSNRVLYDFADIESFDPTGGFYPNDDETCQWCYEWCATNECPPECPVIGCSHTHCFSCYQKGKAFWYLLARLTGWDGQ